MPSSIASSDRETESLISYTVEPAEVDQERLLWLSARYMPLEHRTEEKEYHPQFSDFQGLHPSSEYADSLKGHCAISDHPWSDIRRSNCGVTSSSTVRREDIFVSEFSISGISDDNFSAKVNTAVSVDGLLAAGVLDQAEAGLVMHEQDVIHHRLWRLAEYLECESGLHNEENRVLLDYVAGMQEHASQLIDGNNKKRLFGETRPKGVKTNHSILCVITEILDRALSYVAKISVGDGLSRGRNFTDDLDLARELLHSSLDTSTTHVSQDMDEADMEPKDGRKKTICFLTYKLQKVKDLCKDPVQVSQAWDKVEQHLVTGVEQLIKGQL